MILTHKISLSLDRRGQMQSIDAVQGDSARAVEISLLENGSAWIVPEGTTAVIRYRRAHGAAGGVYDTLPDGTVAYRISENVVTVQLAPQVLAVAGPVEVQVTLGKGGAELTCFSLWIHVQGNLGEVPEDDESYVNLSEHICATVEGMNLAKQENSLYFVVGDTNSSAGVWEGTCQDITEYYDGLTIIYQTRVVGGTGGTTLNINNLGAVPVMRNATYNVDSNYKANFAMLLTYTTVNGTACWMMTDIWWIDSDRKTSAISSTNTMMYLLGAQAVSNGGTSSYVNTSCYIGADNCLYSGGQKVVTEDHIPSEVPDYVRTEAQRLAALVQSRQNGNTVTMMLGSDIHARLGTAAEAQMLASSRHAAQAMQILRQQVHIDFGGLLGDFIWDEEETVEQAMEMNRLISEYFRPAFSGMPQFWCKGNHDMLPSGDVELTDAQVFSAIGIHNSGATFDGANKVLGYCHRDFEEFKLRIVCMNTSETSNSHAVGTAQINWLNSVLAVEDGWKVIVLSHMPLDWWGTSATVYKTVAGFADKILCNIHGHTHNYVCGVVGDTAIPRVAIPNMDFYRANTYSDNAVFGEAVTYTKVADSEADTAFCVITLDLATNKLYADHYGGDAGYDRVVDLNTGDAEGGDSGEDGDTTAYTNQIPLSVDVDGSLYNGGVGYKTDTRINSSGEEVAASGMCCTGFIPVSGTDVVRIKNVTLAGSETAYLILRNTRSNGTPVSGSISGASAFPAADANGVITITIADLNPDARFIRLSVGVIDDTSVITINEPIE